MNNTNIYLVLGMHRSGTSLVSGLLHQSGIIMGTSENFLPKPNKENPKGFFENFDFRHINDRLLACSGYTVKDWKINFNSHKISFLQTIKMQREMRKILQQYAQKYHNWGWKDPRQMLTCQQWFKAFEATKLDRKLKIIFVYRHPLNVALSMQKRGNIEDMTHGLELWYLYNQTAINFLKNKQLPCLVFSFENLMQHTSSVVSNLAKFAEVTIEPNIYNQFVDRTLVRSKIDKSKLNYSNQTYSKVNALFSQLTMLERNLINDI